MKKKIIIVIAVLLVIAGLFWTKGYYNDRYGASEFYYTQIPKDQVNEDSWLVDTNGIKQEKGKQYELIGYNKDGKDKEVYFKKYGSTEDYYVPGTYIKVISSKTITVGVEIIDEIDVPQEALNKIRELGTKLQ